MNRRVGTEKFTMDAMHYIDNATNRGKSGRKRRIKGSKKASQTGSAEESSDFEPSDAPDGAFSTTSIDLDFTDVKIQESKLPPLAGTTAEKMAKYGEKSEYSTLYYKYPCSYALCCVICSVMCALRDRLLTLSI
jgi:hypothetical protein